MISYILLIKRNQASHAQFNKNQSVIFVSSLAIISSSFPIGNTKIKMDTLFEAIIESKIGKGNVYEN